MGILLLKISLFNNGVYEKQYLKVAIAGDINRVQYNTPSRRESTPVKVNLSGERSESTSSMVLRFNRG